MSLLSMNSVQKNEVVNAKNLAPLLTDLTKIENNLNEIKSCTATVFIPDIILNDSPEIQDKMETMKESWSEFIKKHRDLHNSISKFGRTTEKIFFERIDHLNSYFRRANNNGSINYTSSINLLIFDYLLRVGLVDVASAFLREEEVKISLEEKELLEEVALVINSMKKNQFQPLKDWIDKNKEMLTESQIIEFHYIISKLEFLCALSLDSDNYALLIDRAKKMAMFARFFQPDFEYLMGSLAFIHDPNRIKQFYSELFHKLSPESLGNERNSVIEEEFQNSVVSFSYNDVDLCIENNKEKDDCDMMAMDCDDEVLLHKQQQQQQQRQQHQQKQEEEMQQQEQIISVTKDITKSLYYNHFLNELISMFSHQVCTIKQSNPDDPLMALFSSGVRNITEFYNHDQIIKKLYSNNVPDFPLTVKKHDKDLFHSVFHCPVDKTVVSGRNAVVRLKCGHAISKSAFNNLTKNESKTKMKCPYCPSETKTSDALRLIL